MASEAPPDRHGVGTELGGETPGMDSDAGTSGSNNPGPKLEKMVSELVQELPWDIKTYWLTSFCADTTEQSLVILGHSRVGYSGCRACSRRDLAAQGDSEGSKSQ